MADSKRRKEQLEREHGELLQELRSLIPGARGALRLPARHPVHRSVRRPRRHRALRLLRDARRDGRRARPLSRSRGSPPPSVSRGRQGLHAAQGQSRGDRRYASRSPLPLPESSISSPPSSSERRRRSSSRSRSSRSWPGAGGASRFTGRYETRGAHARIYHGRPWPSRRQRKRCLSASTAPSRRSSRRGATSCRRSRADGRGVPRAADVGHPPITVPAWSCMMASRTPGDLGVYGFRNRSDHTYTGGSSPTRARSRRRGSGISSARAGGSSTSSASRHVPAAAAARRARHVLPHAVGRERVHVPARPSRTRWPRSSASTCSTARTSAPRTRT